MPESVMKPLEMVILNKTVLLEVHFVRKPCKTNARLYIWGWNNAVNLVMIVVECCTNVVKTL